MRALRVTAFLCLFLLVSLAADWSQFRGPGGTSVAPDFDPPTAWPEGGAVAWKAKLPGAGWAQPVVSGGKVFVLTAVSDPPVLPDNVPKKDEGGAKDAPKGKGAKMPKKDAPAPKITIDWQLIAVNLADGQIAWARTVAKGAPKYPIHPTNTYATETPAADAERVYAFAGATGTLKAFDHAGKALWALELGVGPTNGLGTASSPALHEGKLFVQQFHENEAKLVCVDARTGEKLWSAARDKGATSWATPLVWTNAGRTEVVTCGKDLVTSHALADGKELWRLTGIDTTFSSTPGSSRDFLVFGANGPGSVAPLYCVKAGATGDITLAKDATAGPFVAWYKKGAAPGMASPVIVDDLAYVPAGGSLTCYEAATGKQVYKERLPNARQIAASPLAAKGKLYFLEESGRLIVIKAGREFEVVAQSQLADTYWASPTPTAGGLLLRGVEGLYYVKK